MKFKISATSYIRVWSLNDQRKGEILYLLEKYPCLKDFGIDDDGYIILSSLEDLERLRAAVRNEYKGADSFVICGSPEDPEIEIYDDYRE